MSRGPPGNGRRGALAIQCHDIKQIIPLDFLHLGGERAVEKNRTSASDEIEGSGDSPGARGKPTKRSTSKLTTHRYKTKNLDAFYMLFLAAQSDGKAGVGLGSGGGTCWCDHLATSFKPLSELCYAESLAGASN